MKNFTTLMLIFVFCVSAFAKDNYPKLSEVKSLASIDKIISASEIDKNTDLSGSGYMLNSLSSNRKLSDNNKTKPKKFNFSIIPYAWLVAIGGTVGEGPNGSVYGFNKGFTFENLHMYAAFMGKIKYERVSFVFDISFFSKKAFDAVVENPNLPKDRSADWTSKQAVYDLFIAYLFPSKSKKTMVDIYGGGRFWDLDLEATITDTNGTSTYKSYTNSWLDPVIGINAEFVLDKKGKWAAWTKGDIGGFGVNSQMTWQMNVGVAYMLSPNFPLGIGFKYLGVNYYKDKFNWTVNEYGPTISIGYRY